MKAFSPAGMAVKDFLGPGPRAFNPLAGRGWNPKQPWGTFGNPHGALAGNGEINGGGGGGGISGTFVLTALNGFPDPNGNNGTGYWDSTFNFGAGAPGTGNVAPASVGGKNIGWFATSARPHAIIDLWFGLYSATVLTRSSFNQIAFTDQFGTPQTLTSASAVQFVSPEANQYFWNWEPPGAPSYFNPTGQYPITVS